MAHIAGASRLDVIREVRPDLLLTHSLPDFADLGVAAASGAAVFLLGGLFFRYMKRGFADVL